MAGKKERKRKLKAEKRKNKQTNNCNSQTDNNTLTNRIFEYFGISNNLSWQIKSSILIVLLLVIMLPVSITLVNVYSFYKTMSASELFIPSISYKGADENKIAQELTTQGFINLRISEDGIRVTGSEEMVKKYRNSFRELRIQDSINKLQEDYSAYNISSIKNYSDYTGVTIKTLTDEVTSASLSQMLVLTPPGEIIDNLCVWTGIANGNNTLKCVFMNPSGKIILAKDIVSYNDLISQVEADETEKAKQQANNDENKTDDNTSNENSDNNENHEETEVQESLDTEE